MRISYAFVFLLFLPRSSLAMEDSLTEKVRTRIANYRNQVIHGAQSFGDLDRRVQSLSGLERMENLCHSELHLQALPLKCYKVINLERKIGLISQPTYRDLRKHLDALCVQKISQISEISDQRFRYASKKWSQENFLSGSCRESLIQRQKRLEYMNWDQQQDLTFEQRFNP